MKQNEIEYFEDLNRLEKYYRKQEKIYWFILCFISALIGVALGLILSHLIF